MIEYCFNEDVRLIREMSGLSQQEFARELKTTQISISRWESGLDTPNRASAESLYAFAWKKGIKINRLRSSFLEDRYEPLLFHGSGEGIKGPLSLSYANPRSDFGVGFYLGESLEQAGTWVCDKSESSVYCFSADFSRLKKASFAADLRWVLCICANRGYLGERAKHPSVKKILDEIEQADLIHAPIADNIMYATIQDFALGYITDEQCSHALSANQLGMQYVFKTEQGLNALFPLARLYLCSHERESYRQIRAGHERDGEEKNKAARISFRGKGRYIDEILS